MTNERVGRLLGFEDDGELVRPRPAPGRKTLTMQLAPSVQRKATAIAAPSGEAAVLGPEAAEWPLIAAAGVDGAGGALPYGDELRASFGRHAPVLDQVRVHDDGRAAGAARAIGADAYATGTSIALAAPPSRELIAHEAAHVVQQRAGIALSGGIGAAGDPYEQHADEVGAAFAAGRSVETLLDRFAGCGGGSPAVQRKASAGAATDTRDGEGAASDLRARIVDLQVAHGGGVKLRLAAGEKQGVRREMSGFVMGPGGLAMELTVTDVAADHCGALVDGALDDVAAAQIATLNPAGGVPRAKIARAQDLRTRVIDVSVDGDGTRITIAAGAAQGVEPGMPAVLAGAGGKPAVRFTIDQLAGKHARAHVPDTVDAVTAHPHVIVNPIAVA